MQGLLPDYLIVVALKPVIVIHLDGLTVEVYCLAGEASGVVPYIQQSRSKQLQAVSKAHTALCPCLKRHLAILLYGSEAVV